MKTIRIGGVPEHFNLPWHLAMEEGDFEYEDLNVIWTEFPGGTGAMNKALRDNEIDVAVILTEGIVKDIIAGNPSKIVQVYVDSPLIWGIHVDANSSYTSVSDLKDTTAAISRKGSGSELMAVVNAKNEGWDIDNLKYEIVGDINGAIKSLATNTSQFFMWEHFTTKPLVDTGVFRRVGDCPTPWPCFVIAVSSNFLENNQHDLNKMLGVINSKTAAFKEVDNVKELLYKRYDQKPEDVEKWLNVTSWANFQISEEDLENVQNTLLELNLIEKKVPDSELIHNLDES